MPVLYAGASRMGQRCPAHVPRLARRSTDRGARRRESVAVLAFPPPQGLYDGQHEHDACGVAFVATLTGEPSHDIVAKALTALRNLEHRGASGAEPDSGDGAGILIQVPDAYYRKVCEFELPAPHSYATGIAFLPAEADDAAKAVARIEELAAEEQLDVVGWRDIPTTPDLLGATARS